MKAFLVILSLFWYVINCSAQILDDFSDGSLSGQPSWFGDTTDFVIRDEKLQLNAITGGRSTIYINSEETTQSKSWGLDCHLGFNPSSSNLLAIYLGLDSPKIESAHGFLIELGAPGDEDKLRFYQIGPGQKDLLATGQSIYEQSPSFRVEIEKTGDLWTIYTLDLSTKIRSLEMEVEVSSIFQIIPSFFAISCQYTDTRKNQFSFDNLRIESKPFVDQLAPRITGIEVSSLRQLILQFSEDLDQTSASNPTNYEILPEIGMPVSASLLADPTLVQLDLGRALMAGKTYLLKVQKVFDLVGNTSVITDSFVYSPIVEIEPYDVLINEIYDDPTPVIGLPEAEYIELYIRKGGFNLDQLLLSVGSRSIPLPSRFVQQGDHLLIYDFNEIDKFRSLPGAIPVSGLPTLVNAGNALLLTNRKGEVIHAVSYDDSWFGDGTKSDGGWSLELINPETPCGLSDNWKASRSLSGGTPGTINSVFDANWSGNTSTVLNLLPVDSVTLRLFLNKSYLSVLDATNFQINGATSVSGVEVLGANRNEILLTLDRPIVVGQHYELTFSELQSCDSTSFSSAPITILIPEKILPGDLVINELLFNPYPGGDDFVEIYNRSNKALLLSDLKVGNQHTGQILSIQHPFLIRPQSYVVVTPDANDLQDRYDIDRVDWLIENPLPAFSNSAGNVTIFTAAGSAFEIIDAFDYQEDLHHALLKDRKGVSLERLNPASPSQNASNWHSAAQSAGYATPTSINSQTYENGAGSGKPWEVSPKVFSPDGDGYDDYMLLIYRDIPTGTFAHVKIFDTAGRQVRYLVNNQSIATNGMIQWDGTTDTGAKASIGIYSIYIHLFQLSGKVTEIKETCVVASRLN